MITDKKDENDEGGRKIIKCYFLKGLLGLHFEDSLKDFREMNYVMYLNFWTEWDQN